MNKIGVAVLVVAALVFTGLGYALGQVIQKVEAKTMAGDLVTEGYVQIYVGEMLAEMQSRIDELEMLLYELRGSSTDTVVTPQPNDPADNPATTPTGNATTSTAKTVKINAENGVNVRNDASASATLVGSANNNAVLTYLGQKNGSDGRAWYNVRLENGTEGWVASWFCFEPE